jgi:uncharacterized protein (DUF362 family)
MDEGHSRRTLMTLLGGGAAALAVGGSALGCNRANGDEGDEPTPTGWTADEPVPGDPVLVIARNGEPAALVDAAMEAIGGMGRFVPAGSRVLVKPNMAWDRAPEMGANTNPQVVARVVELCLAAGAERVTVMDRTCNDARRSYANSGIEAAAKAAGARVVHADLSRTSHIDLGGRVLHEWEVFDEVMAADVRINVPVAKHHGLARVTLGMKNWMGCVGGARDRMHQHIQKAVVDLAAWFRPQLTVLDAWRVMMAGGPAGRDPSHVREVRTLCVGTDPVAVDTFGASLFGLGPDDLSFLRYAEERGLGKRDLAALPVRELDLGA